MSTREKKHNFERMGLIIPFGLTSYVFANLWYCGFMERPDEQEFNRIVKEDRSFLEDSFSDNPEEGQKVQNEIRQTFIRSWNEVAINNTELDEPLSKTRLLLALGFNVLLFGSGF